MTKAGARSINFGTGSNQVNSQVLPSGFTPTTYTPNQVAAEGTDKVSAHLKGIDVFLSGVGGGGAPEVQTFTDATLDPDTELLTLTHSLGTQRNKVVLLDNNDSEVVPAKYYPAPGFLTTKTIIDMRGLTPVPGTWRALLFTGA